MFFYKKYILRYVRSLNFPSIIWGVTSQKRKWDCEEENKEKGNN